MCRFLRYQPALLLLFAAGLLLAAPSHSAPVAIDNADFEALYVGSNLPAVYAGDVPAGAFPTGPAPAGWTAYYETGAPAGGEFIGVLNPGTAADYSAAMAGTPCFPAGAPQGDNMVLLFTSGDAGGNEYGVTQVLTETLQPNTTYTLSVEVGDIQSCRGLVSPYLSFFDLSGFPSYRVQLLADGALLDQDAGVLVPGDGLVETSTVVYTTGPGPIPPGQNLEIRLVNRNNPDIVGVDGLEVDFDDVQLDASPALPVPSGPIASGLIALLIASTGVWIARSRQVE